MHLFKQTFLLFSLNLLDALLTIFWVRNGFATEANQLMAVLLDAGNAPFLVVKIAIGLVTATVLLRYGKYRLAQFGVSIALFVYVSLMGVHIITGLSAFGYISANTVHGFSTWAGTVPALFLSV